MNDRSITPNPYDVLEVSPGASNKEITVAFTMAMKRRKYPPSEIALARKSLINPDDRIIADYLRPIIQPIQHFKHSDLPTLETSPPKLEFLAGFDNLEQAIIDSNSVSESDRRLGKSLFVHNPIQSSYNDD